MALTKWGLDPDWFSVLCRGSLANLIHGTDSEIADRICAEFTDNLRGFCNLVIVSRNPLKAVESLVFDDVVRDWGATALECPFQKRQSY